MEEKEKSATVKLSEPLKLYAVMSEDGKFFRSKGQRGYGDSWVENINEAKIYAKLGQARSRVTFWANSYPKYGIPAIVVMTVDKVQIVNEETRVKKSILGKEMAEKRRKIANLERNIKSAAEDSKRNKTELTKMQNELKKLKDE